jgi:PBP1b-binding outer membrane lipoprotein LpoB
MLKSIKQLAVLTALILLLSGCASQTVNPDDMTLCTNPRPEVCTMEYNPVCGFMQNNDFRTYASPCTACSDSAVVGYTMGDCES